MEKDRETLKNELFDTLDALYKKYKLPKQNINNLEWNAFLNVTYDHFLEHDKLDEYEYAINLLLRRALYFSQLDKCGEFNVNHLKKSLVDLPVYNIYNNEIDLMRNEIDEQSNKKDYQIRLKEILYQAIEDECKADNIKKPDFISEEEWFIAFDVLEAHYLANNMMDKYLYNMYWFVRVATAYAATYQEDDVAKLFSEVIISSGRLDNIENVMRYREGIAISEEFKEKIKNYQASKQGKKYVKQ